MMRQKRRVWHSGLLFLSLADHSEAKWPLIPIQSDPPIPKQDGRLFRCIVASHSDQFGHPEGMIEAALDNPF